MRVTHARPLNPAALENWLLCHLAFGIVLVRDSISSSSVAKNIEGATGDEATETNREHLLSPPAYCPFESASFRGP